VIWVSPFLIISAKHYVCTFRACIIFSGALRGRPSRRLSCTKEGATHLFGPLSQFPPYHLVETHTCAPSSRGESIVSMRLTSRPAHRSRASTVRRPGSALPCRPYAVPQRPCYVLGRTITFSYHNFSCLGTSSSRSCKRVCKPRGSATFSMNNPQARGSTFLDWHIDLRGFSHLFQVTSSISC